MNVGAGKAGVFIKTATIGIARNGTGWDYGNASASVTYNADTGVATVSASSPSGSLSGTTSVNITIVAIG